MTAIATDPAATAAALPATAPGRINNQAATSRRNECLDRVFHVLSRPRLGSMSPTISGLSSLAIPMLAAFAIAAPARADVVSVTANVAGTNLFSITSPGSTSFGKTISAAFAGFDASQGTLTGVSFSYDYEYSFVLNTQGPGGGSGGLNSPLRINGTPFAYGSGSQPGFITLGSSNDFSVTGTAAPDVLSVALATYASAYTFDVFAAGGIGGGGGPGFSMSSSLDLVPSSVTVTYTFDAAQPAGSVPEPASWALVGAAGVALALQRRRKAVRRSASASAPIR